MNSNNIVEKVTPIFRSTINLVPVECLGYLDGVDEALVAQRFDDKRGAALLVGGDDCLKSLDGVLEMTHYLMGIAGLINPG